MAVGDLVYFVKRDGALTSKWTLGMVDELERGRDGVIRKAVIKYCNADEQKLGDGRGNDSTLPRYTERAIRKLVKVFSIEETGLNDDLEEVARRIQVTAGVARSFAGDVPGENFKCKNCCCSLHCGLSLHSPKGAKMVDVALAFESNVDEEDMNHFLEEDEANRHEDEEMDFYTLLDSVGVDFGRLF